MRTLALAAVLGIAFAASPARSAPISEQILARKRIDDSIAIAKALNQAPAAPDTSGRRSSSATDASRETEPVAVARPVAGSASDTSEIKQLPPRTLPFKQQMMFAGGFMVFVALMLTSMQNLNPND